MVVQYKLGSGAVIGCEIDISNCVVWQLSLGNKLGVCQYIHIGTNKFLRLMMRY